MCVFNQPKLKHETIESVSRSIHSSHIDARSQAAVLFMFCSFVAIKFVLCTNRLDCSNSLCADGDVYGLLYSAANVSHFAAPEFFFQFTAYLVALVVETWTVTQSISTHQHQPISTSTSLVNLNVDCDQNESAVSDQCRMCSSSKVDGT